MPIFFWRTWAAGLVSPPRAKKDITPEQYDEFYKPISHDQKAPLASTHNRVEGSTEYTQLVFIPSKAPINMFNRDKAADPGRVGQIPPGLKCCWLPAHLLSGLHILVGNQQFNLLGFGFLTNCQIDFYSLVPEHDTVFEQVWLGAPLEQVGNLIDRTLDSPLGQHNEARLVLAFEPHNPWTAWGVNHMALLNHRFLLCFALTCCAVALSAASRLRKGCRA